MTDEAKKTVRNYLLLKSISVFGVALISATYVVFLTSKGLDLLQINLVNFFFFTTLLIFEIPTGAFADVFGRKLSFIVSCVLFSSGMFIYAFAQSFWGFVLAEVISAAGATFASGAFQAWVIDRLKDCGCDDWASVVFTKEQQFGGMVTIVAAIVGAFAASKNVSLPWLLGGCITLFGGILATIIMKEENFVRQKFSLFGNAAAMTDTVKTSIKYGASNRAVRFVLITGIIQFFCVQAPNMQWQIFFGNMLPSKTYLGFIFSGISAAMIFGASFAPRCLKIVGDARKSLNLIQVAIGVGIFCTVLFKSIIPALIVFMFHEAARGFFSPIKNVYLNENVPSQERATLISFDSISHHVGGMAGLLVSGLVAKYVSLECAWWMSGIVMIASALFLLKRNGANVRPGC